MDFNFLALLAEATLQTFFMAAVAGFLGLLFGFPLGLFLATSAKGEALAAPRLHRFLSGIVAGAASMPFLVLAVAIIPLTHAIAGTAAGAMAAIVPLTIAAVPFFARTTEEAIGEVDRGLVEAFRAMGATPVQIVLKVLLPEAAPAILLAFTTVGVGLLGNAAIVGVIGGGGLGDLSIRFGYERFTPAIMAAVVVVCVVLVQALQLTGERLARRAKHSRRRNL
jgi:D-methionine transport system permease protein